MMRRPMLTLGFLTAFLAASAVSAEEPGPVLYSRHVQAVFSRLGCNGGTCHGAVKGQNGFKLSLFGADPARDFDQLLREDGGRRLSLVDPTCSLLLQKATGQVAHQGGKRMSVGSPEYELLRRWISAGAPADIQAASRVQELKISPPDRTVKPGETYRLRVVARFADGSVEDVTALSLFESREPVIATVASAGQVQAQGVGDTALIVRYRALPALARVVVTRPDTEPFPEVKPHNFVDQHILAKLRRLQVPPAPLADDATFLRRACLDVTGALPTPKEVRAFLADADPEKRSKKIDELLARPGYAALWTLKFCDLLKASDWGEYQAMRPIEQEAPRFQAWVRARLDENLPYDQFVERILTATSREGRTLEAYGQEVMAMQEGFGPARKDVEIYRGRQTLDLYWQRNRAAGVNGALQVAHTFLGLRLECAQCHRHPHDLWQQDDLLSFANFFMRVRPAGWTPDNVQRYPELAAISKDYDAQGKQLGEQVKMMREGEGKKLEAEARQARAESEQFSREIGKLEVEAKQLTEMALKQPAEAAALHAKAAGLREQSAEKRRKVEACKETVGRHEKFGREVVQLERRVSLFSGVANRLLNHEVHLLTKDVPFASITSAIGTQTSKDFRLLGDSKPIDVSAVQDPRTVVMAWMRQPDNPYFAPAIVNRVWAHYFGRGIVDPPDNLSSFNPATHPKLLQELADGFIRNKYDLKWLHRAILNSRTYQQDCQATKANELDRANYAYFYYRRLPAEVLLDALDQATGTVEQMGMEQHHWPATLKTVELPYLPKVQDGCTPRPKNPFVAFMLENFGKPKRNAVVQCDCERDDSASMLQVLSLANHPRVWAKVTDPAGLAARAAKDFADDTQRIDELFLAALSRLPTDEERQLCVKYMKQAKTPVQGLQNVLWGLLNTREFLLQH